MVLPIITPVLATEVGLATQWLPILQRRAIIPHHYPAQEDYDDNIETKPPPQLLSLVADDTSQVGYHDFVQHFRQTVLADALAACYNSHSDYYLASCTAAIEEFCTTTADTAEPQTALHLEAALYCMTVVADEVLLGMSASSNPPSPARKSAAAEIISTPTSSDSKAKQIRGFLEKCTVAIAKKPKSLSNPLTMSQACCFIQKVRFKQCEEKLSVYMLTTSIVLCIANNEHCVVVII
jgi:hypothetical protein